MLEEQLAKLIVRRGIAPLPRVSDHEELVAVMPLCDGLTLVNITRFWVKHGRFSDGCFILLVDAWPEIPAFRYQSDSRPDALCFGSYTLDDDGKLLPTSYYGVGGRDDGPVKLYYADDGEVAGAVLRLMAVLA